MITCKKSIIDDEVSAWVGPEATDYNAYTLKINNLILDSFIVTLITIIFCCQNYRGSNKSKKGRNPV